MQIRAHFELERQDRDAEKGPRGLEEEMDSERWSSNAERNGKIWDGTGAKERRRWLSSSVLGAKYGG